MKPETSPEKASNRSKWDDFHIFLSRIRNLVWLSGGVLLMVGLLGYFSGHPIPRTFVDWIESIGPEASEDSSSEFAPPSSADASVIDAPDTTTSSTPPGSTTTSVPASSSTIAGDQEGYSLIRDDAGIHIGIFRAGTEACVIGLLDGNVFKDASTVIFEIPLDQDVKDVEPHDDLAESSAENVANGWRHAGCRGAFAEGEGQRRFAFQVGDSQRTLTEVVQISRTALAERPIFAGHKDFLESVSFGETRAFVLSTKPG